MEKDMEREKNIIKIMMIYKNLKENIKMEVNGVEKDIIMMVF